MQQKGGSILYVFPLTPKKEEFQETEENIN